MKINLRKRTKKAQELLDNFLYTDDIKELDGLVETGVITEKEEEDIINNYPKAS